MLKTTRVLVNAAVSLTPSGFDIDQEYEIVIRPSGANAIYLGPDSGVDSTNGLQLSVSVTEFRLQLKPREELYAYAGSNTYVYVLTHST